jgi:hypothetical protein
MARCACGTGTCSCVIKAGPEGGVSVVGNGSANRPYVISIPGGNPLLNLDVVDDPTLDLTISGAGTATDKRKITGRATQSLTNLKDVQGTPTEGEIPVWRTNHWEFEAAAAAGLPISGSWGTPPLDDMGTDSLAGQQIYLDVNSQLRAAPQATTTAQKARSAADLAGTYPVGLSNTQITSAQATAGGWPGPNSGHVVTYRRAGEPDADAVAAQWFYQSSGIAAKVLVRTAAGTGASNTWSPWVQVGADVHYAAYKTVAQVMATSNAWYTPTFENIEANVGGITYSAGVFTVPMAGQYAINFSSHIQNTVAATTVSLGLLKNGLTMADMSFGTTNTNKNWSLSRVLRCAAGDTLSIRGRANVANANFYGSTGTKYTYIDITKVGG